MVLLRVREGEKTEMDGGLGICVGGEVGMVLVDDVVGAPNAAGAGVVVGVAGGVEVSAVVGMLAVAPARFAVEEVAAGPGAAGWLGALVI